MLVDIHQLHRHRVQPPNLLQVATLCKHQNVDGLEPLQLLIAQGVEEADDVGDFSLEEHHVGKDAECFLAYLAVHTEECRLSVLRRQFDDSAGVVVLDGEGVDAVA